MNEAAAVTLRVRVWIETDTNSERFFGLTVTLRVRVWIETYKRTWTSGSVQKSPSA